tara:strand:- start:1858 stop:2124 length:267 start_codon:yes stop_codon:yes gene_type:complete
MNQLTENLAEVQKILEKENMRRIKNRERSLKAYYKKYVINEDMTEAEKDRVRENIKIRKQKNKDRYNADPEHQRERMRQYRAKKKASG